MKYMYFIGPAREASIDTKFHTGKLTRGDKIRVTDDEYEAMLKIKDTWSPQWPAATEAPIQTPQELQEVPKSVEIQIMKKTKSTKKTTKTKKSTSKKTKKRKTKKKSSTKMPKPSNEGG